MALWGTFIVRWLPLMLYIFCYSFFSSKKLWAFIFNLRSHHHTTHDERVSEWVATYIQFTSLLFNWVSELLRLLCPSFLPSSAHCFLQSVILVLNKSSLEFRFQFRFPSVFFFLFVFALNAISCRRLHDFFLCSVRFGFEIYDLKSSLAFCEFLVAGAFLSGIISISFSFWIHKCGI